MKTIRVLIVDDHTLVRDGIRALLSLAMDIDVIGEAANGKEALDKIRQLAPDVVLMDLAMPVMGGLDAIRRIRKRFPAIKVLALTQYDDTEYVVPVIEAGARGFITKMAAFSELSSAIQAVYGGGSYLSPSAAAALVDECQMKIGASSSKDPYDMLSDREKEVFRLVAEGNTARQIADMLALSTKTIEWYKSTLMQKLHLHTRTDLIKLAIRRSLITM